jgi:hypothetical protein
MSINVLRDLIIDVEQCISKFEKMPSLPSKLEADRILCSTYLKEFYYNSMNLLEKKENNLVKNEE